METQERIDHLTGKEGAVIAVNVASDWTKNYRSRNAGDAISHFFGYEILQRILNQPDCIGIRIYYANSQPLSGWQRFVVGIANFLIKDVANSTGDVHLILSGVTREGTDQIPGIPEGAEEHTVQALKLNIPAGAPTANILGEQSVVCPGGVGCPTNTLTGKVAS
jgi:hypothetical protein